LSHGLAGNCGIGHCGNDSGDVRLAGDATAAPDFPGGRPLWLFGPFNQVTWPKTLDHFPRPEGRAPADFGPEFLSLRNEASCDTLQPCLTMCKVNSSLYTFRDSGDRSAGGGQTHWIPNTDVYIADGQLVIKVELAGMHREDLELTIDGNRLMISGQRPDSARSSKCKFLVVEINYGPFECVIEIPPGYDLSKAKAAYQNGFLNVEVPQTAARSHSKHIVISDEK
jgi:HSP20 family protein